MAGKHAEEELSFQKGATTFEYDSSRSPEEIVSDIIETLDEHHGPEWSEGTGEIPGWTYIEVHGCDLCEAVQCLLQEYGINNFRETEYGFVGIEGE